MRHFQRTALSVAAAQAALLFGGVAMAQTAPQAAAPPASAASGATGTSKDGVASLTTVVISGQRAALASAQKIKQNSDEIVDSIVASDIGKLPDKSVTEVLQRIVGITIDHTMTDSDPEHFSVEGSGVAIRGLTYVRSELNGGDEFSANGGRALNFEDVPPELMAGVDVYKNPSAEQIEGAIGGLVNLRTAMPFDYKGFKATVTGLDNYSTLRAKSSPSVSGLISDRWDTDLGEFGALLDLAHSDSYTRTDAFQVEAYYPLTENGQSVWVPPGISWRTLTYDRQRAGTYAALQWKKNDVDSSLTYFKSKYKMTWNENAIFSQSNTYNTQVAPGATYGANGNLLIGTLSDPADGGVNFGDDTRVATRNSASQDVTWNLHWKANNQLSFQSSLQLIRATTNSFDSTVGTGVQMPEENLNLTGSIPSLTFSPSDVAYLANPDNYYWGYTMEHLDASTSNEKAWRGDATYKFENSSFLDDLRVGLRFTDRAAQTINSVPGYNWAAITQPWELGYDISGLAYLGDPRFSGNTYTYNFKNFFGKNMSVPSLVFPTPATAAGYPSSYATLHSYHDVLCAEQAAAQGWSDGCPAWAPATFGTNPAGTNDQSERTQAAYAQLRFGFDDLPMPIDGNVGMRVVHTNASANGYTVFTANAVTVPTGTTQSGLPIPPIANFSTPQNFTNSFTDVLPSLNLRMKGSDDWQYRFAVSRGITRPDFTQLQAYTTLTQAPAISNSGDVTSLGQTGTGSGNPMLKPTQSTNFDLTAEWYFSKTGSLTFAAFDKELKDIIVNQLYNVPITDENGNVNNFPTTAPVNGAKGYARGLEVAFQRYLDFLPGWWSGFGVQANYTFVDSHETLYNPVNSQYCSSDSSVANLNLNLNGCDTNGETFGNLPLVNLSRNAFNLALMYDYGPISARIAYNWRGKYLQAVNVNGTQGTDGTDTNPNSATYGQHNIAYGLPTWALGYGQMDASVFYKVTDKFSVGLQGSNLTNALYKQAMQQHIGMMGRAWFATGPSYTVRASYDF